MALEFQSEYIDYNKYWGNIFFVSSCLVAICQGLILGEVVSRFTSSNRVPQLVVIFLCILLLVLIYCVSGMAWQYLKTKDGVAKRTAVNGKITVLLLLFVVFLVGLLFHYHVLQHQVKLQSFSKQIFLKSVFAFALGCYGFIFFLFRENIIKRYRLPFILCSVAVLAGIIATGIYMFPYFLPPDVSIQSAVSPTTSTLRFLIYGILGCMPVVLSYNIYAVYVFRGRDPL
jgi:cytochrome d ubiquinol oxidase subunit II